MTRACSASCDGGRVRLGNELGEIVVHARAVRRVAAGRGDRREHLAERRFQRRHRRQRVGQRRARAARSAAPCSTTPPSGSSAAAADTGDGRGVVGFRLRNRPADRDRRSARAAAAATPTGPGFARSRPGSRSPANRANQPKCSAASSGDLPTTGTFRRRPITSAMSLDGHALVGDPVIPGAGGALLERQPVEAGGIEPVHGGPAVVPVAHIGREALLARDGDEDRERSRGRRRHGPTARAAPPTRARRATPTRAPLLRNAGEARVGRRRDRLRSRGGPARGSATPEVTTRGRSDPGERGAERLDRALVGLAGGREVREVVDEGGVDHAVRLAAAPCAGCRGLRGRRDAPRRPRRQATWRPHPSERGRAPDGPRSMSS